MYRNQFILTYLLMFVSIAFILEMLGIISISIVSIFAYAVIFYGLSLVYISFESSKLKLFFGTAIFLTGLALFIVSSFDFSNPGEVAFPASFLIIGLSFLMLYFSSRKDLAFAVLGILFTAAGVITVIITGNIQFNEYLSAVIKIIKSYWPIILIFLAVVLLLGRRNFY